MEKLCLVFGLFFVFKTLKTLILKNKEDNFFF